MYAARSGRARACLAAYEEALDECAHQQMLADGVLVLLPAPPLLSGETGKGKKGSVRVPGENGGRGGPSPLCIDKLLNLLNVMAQV